MWQRLPGSEVESATPQAIGAMWYKPGRVGQQAHCDLAIFAVSLPHLSLSLLPVSLLYINKGIKALPKKILKKGKNR